LLLQVYVWWNMLEEEEHCYRKSTHAKGLPSFCKYVYVLRSKSLMRDSPGLHLDLEE
jgi:hypothetical protein